MRNFSLWQRCLETSLCFFIAHCVQYWIWQNLLWDMGSTKYRGIRFTWKCGALGKPRVTCVDISQLLGLKHSSQTPSVYLWDKHFNFGGFSCLTGWTIRGSNPGIGEIFLTRPDWPRGPPIFMSKGYYVPFLRGKTAGAWCWPPTPI
jgi:hypothetical protein